MNQEKKEEALLKARSGELFLWESLEWNDDKDIALAIIENSLYHLYYLSPKLQDDEEVVMKSVAKLGENFQYASERLRSDKSIVLEAVRNYQFAYEHSLLYGYQYFNAIVKKEGEEFLFSCYKNRYYDLRLEVANHPNFLPTVEQIEQGLNDKDKDVQSVYQLRKDEWLAKMEANKLVNSL